MEQVKMSEGMRKAAALVRHGWCRNALHKPPEESGSGKHEYCVIGAMVKAGIWDRNAGGCRQLFQRVTCGEHIINYNNKIAKDGEEVAQKLELAAELAELEEQTLKQSKEK